MSLNLFVTVCFLLLICSLSVPCLGQKVFYNATEKKRDKASKADSSVYRSLVKDSLMINGDSSLKVINRNNFAGFSPSANIYNSKDLVMIGLAHRIKKYGLRKESHVFEQRVSALIAPITAAFELKYHSTFYSLLGQNFDLVLSGRYIGPSYDFNFFGIGNSTANTEKPDYYRIRSKITFFDTYLQHRFSDKIKAGIGTGMEYVNILTHSGHSFLNDAGMGNASYNWFLKASSYFEFDYRDNLLTPKKGWKWAGYATYSHQTTNNKFNHFKLYTDFSSYFTPFSNIPATMAFRTGASVNIGDYNFFHASRLGNYRTLRGFRAQRFSGNFAAYGNAETRITLTKIRSSLIAGECGIYGFYDIGRVKSDLMENNKWHKGYGPGVWVNLFDSLVLSLGSGFSKEGMTFSFDTGFRF